MPDLDFVELYRNFNAPIIAFNCGERCAPHNERGVPFCCDTAHAVPALYTAEWDYLQVSTDQWREWEGRTPRETERIRKQLPDGQIAAVCQGHALCQRGYRSITCRSFPFYPYIDRDHRLVGITYYWEYEDRCWVISNLTQVTSEFRLEFLQAYERLFEALPDEFETYRQNSITMRRVFSRRKRAIPLLHRNGGTYKISPRTGRMRRVSPDTLPAYGPYRLARELPFPDET